MRPDLYVSHVASDIEPASLVIDFFEASVPGLEGHVGCSSLPGYAATDPDLEDAIVVGIVDGWLPEDVANELLLAVERAARVMLLILRGGPQVEVPDALSHVPQLELHEGTLAMLAEDLGEVVALRGRRSEAALDAREELLALAARRSTAAPLSQPAPPADAGDEAITDSQRSAYRVFGLPAESLAETPSSDTAPIGGGPRRTSSLVPKPRRPSALLSVSAGCALAEAVFGGQLGEAELVVLDGEFAEFIHGLGGDWFQLRVDADAEGLAEAVDDLLASLVGEQESLRHWYEAGYQLALFCCLCTCDAGADAALQSQLAQARGRAWNAFWHASAEVGLPEHAMTALNALLEDVDAPGGMRTEAAQCTEVLRNAGHDWDRAHRPTELPGPTSVYAS